MRKLRPAKIDKGLCRWPKCNSPCVGGKPKAFKNDEWILPFYCEQHGQKALKFRKERIAEWQSSATDVSKISNQEI